MTQSRASADLSCRNERAGRFTVEVGKTVEPQIGTSSADVRLRGTVSVMS